jgi:hypothetical protein
MEKLTYTVWSGAKPVLKGEVKARQVENVWKAEHSSEAKLVATEAITLTHASWSIPKLLHTCCLEEATANQWMFPCTLRPTDTLTLVINKNQDCVTIRKF